MGLRAFVKRKILCRKPRVLLYVDPTNGDVYDQRVELVREACAAHQTQLVCVWSRSFSRMLINRADTDNEYAALLKRARSSHGRLSIFARAARWLG